ncbi:MAG: hypothetical protein ACI38Q_07480 [Candidatus Bruticola sp.]
MNSLNHLDRAMKHSSEKIVDEELDRAVFVKADHVRVFKENSVWAIDLESGSVMNFTDLGKSLYMACNGLDNVQEIGRCLGISTENARCLFLEMMRAGFIKIAGNVVSVKESAAGTGVNCSFGTDTCVFDARELEENVRPLNEIEQKWRDRGYAFLKHLGNTAHVPTESRRPIFYFRNWDWYKHSQILSNLLSVWMEIVGLSDEALPSMNKVVAPFKVVIESAVLPKASQFVDICRGCASEELLCNWERLTDLGLLWCRLHLLSAHILWSVSPADIKQGNTSAFAKCFKFEPVKLPGLAAAAEISSMLLDTAIKHFALPSGYCGSFPIAGISVMPVVCCSHEGELKEIAENLAEVSCCTWGFSLNDSLLSASPAWLEKELDELLLLCFNSNGLSQNTEIFPLTRWLKDILGYVDRCESLETVLNRKKAEPWFKNKCRRCPNWHFCASSFGHPSLPCSWLTRQSLQILRRVADLPSNKQHS